MWLKGGTEEALGRAAARRWSVLPALSTLSSTRSNACVRELATRQEAKEAVYRQICMGQGWCCIACAPVVRRCQLAWGSQLLCDVLCVRGTCA